MGTGSEGDAEKCIGKDDVLLNALLVVERKDK